MRNPLQPITKETRMIVLSYTSSDSAGGITRAHSLIPGGAQTPRGWDPELQRSDLQSKSHQDQSRGQGASFEIVSSSFWRVSPSGRVFRILQQLPWAARLLFADLSVHAQTNTHSSGHRYFLYVILYTSDDPWDLTDDYHICFQLLLNFLLFPHYIYISELCCPYFACIVLYC